MRPVRLLVGAWLCLAAAHGQALAVDKPKLDGETRRFYFPNAIEAGSKTVQPGDEILRRPVVWAFSAQLDAPVALQTADGPVMIDGATILPVVKISGLPGESGEVLAYCTAAPRFKPKTTGFLFGSLGAKAIRSMSDGRKCLYDKDGDGAAEFGFLLDEGNAKERAPQSIAPVPLNITQNREIGSGDYVVITLRQASRPSFKVDVFENGAHVSVGSQRIDLPKDATFPSEVDVFGARLTVLAHDKKNAGVTLSWTGGDKDARIPVRSETVYIFTYSAY